MLNWAPGGRRNELVGNGLRTVPAKIATVRARLDTAHSRLAIVRYFQIFA